MTHTRGPSPQYRYEHYDPRRRRARSVSLRKSASI